MSFEIIIGWLGARYGLRLTVDKNNSMVIIFKKIIFLNKIKFTNKI